jgi:hypothetical protein
MLKFLQFFQERGGSLSSNRLVYVIWMLGMLIVWGNLSFKENKMAEIPESNLLVIALLLTGKVLQKNIETTDPNVKRGPKKVNTE